MRPFLIAIFLFTGFLFANPVLAAATAISASRLIVRTEPGQVESRELVVSNLSAATQQYRLYLENEGESALLASFIPRDFNIAPNESQRVLIRLRVPQKSRQARLAIVSSAASQPGNLKIASGIKIPVYFIVPPRTTPVPLLGEEGILSDKGGAVFGNAWVYTLYGIDLILFFVVCFLWQRRLWWRRHRISHKISFL